MAPLPISPTNVPMTERRDRAHRLLGFIAALVAVSIWAGWIPMTRLALSVRLRPEDVTAVRFGIPGLVLLPVLLLRWREVPWQRPMLLLPLVIGPGALYQLLFGHGLAIANSGQAAVLGPGLVSALVLLLSMPLLGDRPSGRQVIGLVFTLAGVAAVVGHDLLSGRVHFLGYAMIVTASAGWAAYTMASRVLKMKPLVTAALISVVNAWIYVPIYLANGGAAHLAALPADSLWLQTIYQGVLTGVVAMVAFAYAVEELGASTAASVMPLSPVLVAVFGWLLLGDRVDAATAIGLVAVGLGVLVANRRGGAPATAFR